MTSTSPSSTDQPSVGPTSADQPSNAQPSAGPSSVGPSSTSLGIVSVTDALTAALRGRILDGAIPAGAPVAEVEVAREFRVSRPTAKTAIRVLVTEGLLRHGPHRPAWVPRLSAADVADLFTVRTPLELAMVERLAGTRGPVPGADRAVRALRELAVDAPTSRFVEVDLSFHRRLVQATGSSRLRRLYDLIDGEIHLGMVQTRRVLGRDRIGTEHAAILAAIETGQSTEAVRLMRAHLYGARDALLAES